MMSLSDDKQADFILVCLTLKYCGIDKKREKLTLSASFHVIFSRTF